MGISSSKNNDTIISYNSEVLKCISNELSIGINVHHFYLINENEYKLNLNINKNTCTIHRITNFSYDNVYLNVKMLKTPAKVLTCDEHFHQSQKQTVIYDNQIITYEPSDIETYDYYIRNNKLYKTKINSVLYVLLKNTPLIEQYIKTIYEVFIKNCYQCDIQNVKFIKLKVLNIKMQTDLLQLLKENSSVNITIVPELVVTKKMCKLIFKIGTIDDKIDEIPATEQIIIVDNVEIFGAL